MQNADIEKELADVQTAAAELRELLSKSDTLTALPLAEGYIEATKLNGRLRKLAARVGKVVAPLFGKPPDDGQENA